MNYYPTLRTKIEFFQFYRGCSVPWSSQIRAGSERCPGATETSEWKRGWTRENEAEWAACRHCCSRVYRTGVFDWICNKFLKSRTELLLSLKSYILCQIFDWSTTIFVHILIKHSSHIFFFIEYYKLFEIHSSSRRHDSTFFHSFQLSSIFMAPFRDQ